MSDKRCWPLSGVYRSSLIVYNWTGEFIIAGQHRPNSLMPTPRGLKRIIADFSVRIPVMRGRAMARPYRIPVSF